MTHREQIAAFEGEIRNVIAKFIAEFDLTTADAVGVLECVKHTTIRDALEENDL